MQHDADVHDEPAVAAAGSTASARPSATAAATRRARAGDRARRARTGGRCPRSRTRRARTRAPRRSRARRGPPRASIVSHADPRRDEQPVAQHLAARGPPRQRGRDRHEEQQREADRRGHAVEVRLPHRQPAARAAPRRCSGNTVPSSTTNASAGEQQVVGEERRLARHRRVDAAGRAQLVAAPRDEPDAGGGDDAEEREQPRADRRTA